MNLTFIQRHNTRHLILIMAGWAMDDRLFRNLELDGYDIAVTWDYTNEKLDYEALANYREVVVIAWSMGVMECERTVAQYHLPVTLAIAINGTSTPVDDETGIAEKVFAGTLDNLSESNLARFNRRMCGTGDNYRKFLIDAPSRSLSSVKEELRLLGQRAVEPGIEMSFFWDIALIGSNDLIFTPQAQFQAWKNVRTAVIDSPHLPDFMSIINRYVVNKSRVGSRFNMTRTEYETSASIQQTVARTLISRLQEIDYQSRDWDKIIEIGSGSGSLTRLYASTINYNSLELWDLSPSPQNPSPDRAINVTDDAESRLHEILPRSIDLIISASTLQWFNSPAKAIRNIAKALKPGGIAAVSLYTSGTFKSFASHLDVSLNYADPDRLINSLSNDCIIEHYSTDCHMQQFDTTRQLLQFLKATGVDAAGHSNLSRLRKVLCENRLLQLEYYNTSLILRKK